MKKQRGAPVLSSQELAEIVRSVSKAQRSLPLRDHLAAIKERRAQEAESFLRACAVRLRLPGS